MRIFPIARLRSWAVLLAVAAALPVVGQSARAESASVLASTDRGAVSGVRTASGSKFLGIPYAAPPLGALRFRAPEPPPRWRGVRPADQFGARCPQKAGTGVMDEDCLFLNVYTPAKDPGRKPHRYPVMVYFHGGGLQSGSGNGYDPTRFVELDVVVVTINFRLGELGLLAHPALTAESPDGSSGNYTLLDQQQALRWVRANIANFSGDPRNVTIVGQSAGGLSVLAQLASPLSAGLFQGAISQSGSYALSQPSLAAAQAEGEKFASVIGCSDAGCLRGAPVEVILAAQGSPALEHLPLVDGKVLPESVLSALQGGRFQRVPVIIGSTHDETTSYVAMNAELVRGPIPSANYGTAIASSLALPDALVPGVIAEYPLENYVSPGQALAALTTDALFGCSVQRAARLLAAHVPTFVYEFDDPDAPTYLPSVSFPYGAYHGSDLQYYFVTFPGEPSRPPFTEDQARLSEIMLRYWTQFARQQTPNGRGTPAWRRFDPARGVIQALVPPQPEPYAGAMADHHCDFWQ